MRAHWTEISTAALRHNLRAYRRRLGRRAPPAICAVVKANAYGHGLLDCARVFAAERVPWFAVATVEQGAALRAAGLRQRVLVLGAYDRADAAEMARLGLTATVWDFTQLELLRQRARRGGALTVHVKIDTGMGRLGIEPEAAARLAAAVRATPGLRLEAMYSHLRSADDDDPATRAQLRLLLATVRPIAPPFWHLANSAAAWRFPASRGGLVRVGLGLYGYGPGRQAAAALRPALSWKARIIAIRELPAGRRVGYGGEFVTRRRSRIAVLASGYADGYSRRLWESRGHVLVRGRRAPIAGRVSMDLTSVDVTDIPGAQVGEVAVLLGRQGRQTLTAGHLAAWCGTIPYEILCAIAARVPRRLI
ncbi:MAG TPA: alanine racemase [Terriglobales bacterium]|nr:alanine racemase [Terriglobales bacterium]